MPRISTTSNLSSYPQAHIKRHTKEIQQASQKEVMYFSYEYRGKPYRYTVKLTTTQCNYGGVRYWYLCPNCSKRVGVLYCAGWYVCRHCIGANYATQMMQPLDKLFRRVEKIRHRLGWQAGIAHGQGNRPKGMHYTTFNRLLSEHNRMVDCLLGKELEWVSNLNSKLNRRAS